ncbi:MAG: FapA family protein [Spirochaetales bacterium]|nr:FapA family protein [Spirochaetales bacterium]
MGTVKGKIELLLNSDKTQARLVYTPGSPGEVWDMHKVLAFLEKERVVYGVNRDRIQEALDLFGETDEKTRSHIVARGTAPKVKGVSFSLTDREVDEDLRRIITAVIQRAAPPKFNEKVSPKLKGVTYVVKGEVVGSLFDPETVKPGSDVFGNELQAPDMPGGEFLVGKGIEKTEGGELTAGKTGIIRLGENWIDLLPFQNHQWDITFSKDGASAYLEFVPGMRSFKAPEGKKILEEVRDRGMDGDGLIEEKAIEEFMANLIETRKAGKLNLMNDRDGKVEISLDPSKTSARLILKKGLGGGQALSLKEVSKILNESKLKGMDPERTKKEIMDFYNSSGLEATLPLCEGTKPTRGKDREVKFSVDFLDDSYRELLMDKVELDSTLVSFYESIKDFPVEKVAKLANVEKDQKIFSLSADGKGKEGKDVYGNVIPGLSGNDPVLYLFENIDYRNGSGTALIAGLLEVFEDSENRCCYARIREHKNSPIQVTLSENKMSATLSIGLAEGTGFSADQKMILEALEKAGVKAGILDEKVDEAAEASGLGEVVSGLVAAEGKIPLDDSRELKLLHDIDYRDKNKNTVALKEGDEIGHLISSGDTKGFTVTGDVLEPESGEDSIEIGENIKEVETDEQDVVTLVAEKSGRLIFTGSKLFVQDTVLVEGDLSPHLGKVVFPGTVDVRGSVLSKSMIDAGEDVRVDGVVQAALVSAGRSIKISKGIKGSQKAVLRGQNLEFDYAEEATIMASETLVCHKAMMRCQVRCNGHIRSSDGQCKIVGGEIKVRDDLEVASIGNERGIETVIHFGQDFLIEDRIAQIVRDTEKLQLQVVRIDEIIDKARGRPDKQDLMMSARDKKVRMLKTLEKKNVKLFLLREKFEEHFDSTIKITGELHEGTVFHSHGRKLDITVKKRSVEIFFDRESGKICEKPLT